MAMRPVDTQTLLYLPPCWVAKPEQEWKGERIERGGSGEAGRGREEIYSKEKKGGARGGGKEEGGREGKRW